MNKNQLIITFTGIIGLFLSTLPIILFWLFLQGHSCAEPNKVIAGIELALGLLIFFWFLFIVIWAQRRSK
jgi:hypothetical protein